MGAAALQRSGLSEVSFYIEIRVTNERPVRLLSTEQRLHNHWYRLSYRSSTTGPKRSEKPRISFRQTIFLLYDDVHLYFFRTQFRIMLLCEAFCLQAFQLILYRMSLYPHTYATCPLFRSPRSDQPNNTEPSKRIRTIQGVSRLYGITAGGDFVGLCDQRSSYKHVSDFGRLRSYDRLKLRIDGNDY